MSRLRVILLDKYHLALLGILAVAAYLRLWNLNGLFNAVHDYDEGVYSLGARFMAQGYVPYQDFILAHPPLYSLLLSWVYRIFGYNFFYGKFLSVALSLAAVVLVYLIGKRLFSRGAGLVAAAIMAVAPDMVYPGRRVVQESLGILLLLIAIYFAVLYIKSQKPSRLAWCGVFLGLMVATKYIFAPAALAVVIFILLFQMGPRFWESIRVLGRASFWLSFMGLAAVAFAIALVLKWVFYVDIAIPFIDPTYYSAVNFAVSAFVLGLPFLGALLWQAGPGWVRRWWQAIVSVLRRKDTWLLIGGAALGFVAVTGFFLIRAPQQFIHQTLFMQQERPYLEFPSLVTMFRTAPGATGFLKMAFLPIISSIPLALIMARRSRLEAGAAFLVWGMALTLAASQFFYYLPRYYIALFPFFVLGVASFTPSLDAGLLRSQLSQIPTAVRNALLTILAVLAIFTSLTVTLLTNYTGYDINWPFFSTAEKYVYAETVAYLEQVGAKKVFAANAIFPALSKEINSTLSFDSFALIWLEEQDAEDIIKARLAEGVDYVVLDSWVRYWGVPYNQQAEALTQAVRKYGRLVQVIAPDTGIYTEIYRLSDTPQGIMNGAFSDWVTTEKHLLPLGWQRVSVTGEGDGVDILQASAAGRDCLWLALAEDGVADEYDLIYTGLMQQGVAFPDGAVSLTALPTEITAPASDLPLGASVHFRDSRGHDLSFGFSDEITEAKVIYYDNEMQTLVLLPSVLNQWAGYELDVGAYWDSAGWDRPQALDVYLIVSADADHPGLHSFYVAAIG